MLYIVYPAGFSACHTDCKISFCLWAHISTFSKLHSVMAVSSLRNIPSPEQGASTRIRSNCSPLSPICCGVLLVTITSGFPHLVRFSAKIWARPLWISFVTNRLPLGSHEQTCVDLPPGAAHRSRTVTGSVKLHCLTACSTNIDEAS